MIQLLFIKLLISFDGIHNLKVSSITDVLAKFFHPKHKMICFPGITQMQKSINCKRCIPDPCIAVVPISATSNMLRQAKSWRRYHGAKIMRSKQLKDQSG